MWLFYWQFKINHPESEDLGFLYGSILTDGKDAYSEEATTNICVFADEQVSRLCLLGSNLGLIDNSHIPVITDSDTGWQKPHRLGSDSQNCSAVS